MLKTQARHVFFFVKSIQTHIRPKKLSAALFLQQRAFLCFMLLSCLSLVDRCDIDQGQLLHICIFQTGYECGCGIQRGQYVDTCLDRVPADDESVFGVLNTLGRSIDDKVDLVAEDQVHQVRGRPRQIGAVYFEDLGDAKIFPSADRQLFDVMFDWVGKRNTNPLVREIAAGGICSMSAEDAENISAAINNNQRSIR